MKKESPSRTFSCPKCGESYKAHPPDDVHTVVTLEPPEAMSIDHSVCIDIPHDCPNCDKVTRLYWTDPIREQQVKFKDEYELNDSQYKFIKRDDVVCTCGSKNEFYFSYLGLSEDFHTPRSHGTRLAMVCKNPKCRKVIAWLDTTKSASFIEAGPGAWRP